MCALMVANPFMQFGSETLATIRKDFYLPERKLYGEERTVEKPAGQVAFNWGVGVMLSALNSAARSDAKYEPWLREYADATRVYWNPAGPVPGFDVLPTPKPVDRYYDDNAWMVMSLVETYEVLKDRKYLDSAREALAYVLSGRDDTLGGGIYWRESDKASKNTCANAPAVAAAMAVYEHTKDPSLLQVSKDVYDWTKKTLQDPEDKLMWDAINLNGEIGKMKWTYNTGLMIRAAKALYQVTKEGRYLEDAREMERASLKHWLPENGKSGARCEGKFAHLMFEGWAFAPAFEEGLKARDEALRFVYEKAKDPNGRYGNRWERPAEGAREKFSLIDQASAARAFFEAA
ncbi:MAG TPA: glycoside hydrolase family 76 protein, partial [Fimbriimonas sp.]